MRYGEILVVLALFTPGLAACATPQGMTVASGTAVNPAQKYRNAIGVRSMSGGQVMNLATVPGVPNEALKAALESTLAANGYLSRSGTPKFYLDAVILDLHRPLRGLTLNVTADVAYGLFGGGKVDAYHIVTTGRATFSDSPIGADRVRIANERAMHQNIEQFLRALN